MLEESRKGVVFLGRCVFLRYFCKMGFSRYFLGVWGVWVRVVRCVFLFWAFVFWGLDRGLEVIVFK